MDRATWKGLWLGVSAAGVAVITTLIAASGSMAKWSICTLVMLGIIFFCASLVGLGWNKASRRHQTIFKTVLLFAIVCSAMIGLGWGAWPKPPIIEISKEIKILSIVVAPGADANIGMLKDGFKVDFVLYSNDQTGSVNWVKPCPGLIDKMFLYHVFNHSPYPVTNLKATFDAQFLGGNKGVDVLGSNQFDVYIKTVSANGSSSFYIVNESRYSVMITSPENIELQVPGESKSQVPILRGEVIMGTLPISDIAGDRGQIDLPLDATHRNWDGTGCQN